jgi:hypothetical protein
MRSSGFTKDIYVAGLSVRSTLQLERDFCGRRCDIFFYRSNWLSDTFQDKSGTTAGTENRLPSVHLSDFRHWQR